jgi:pimeloyl-ACP methyl ester carboxylesterase
MMTTAAEPWVHREAVVNGVRLHYVEAGSGPLAILLHGFPEFWFSWRHQIPALAAAGFRVLAPDLRGYNESDKPAGVDAYRVEALTADVAGLIRHAGAGRAAVVGHDWGGVLAWLLPARHPRRRAPCGPQRAAPGCLRPGASPRRAAAPVVVRPLLPTAVVARTPDPGAGLRPSAADAAARAGATRHVFRRR